MTDILPEDIKVNLSNKYIEKLFQVYTNFLKPKNYETICSIGMGNPLWYNLLSKFHKKNLIYTIEDELSKWIYLGRNDILSSHIFFTKIRELELGSMHYNKIIMNPPFGSKHSGITSLLHYNITEKVLNKCEECISLMPITIISNSKDTLEFKRIKKEFDKSLLEIDIYDSKEFFPETKMPPVGIFVFSKKKTTNDKIKIKNNITNTEIFISSLLSYSMAFSDEDKKILEKFKSKNKMNFNDERVSYWGYYGKGAKEIKASSTFYEDYVIPFTKSKKMEKFSYYVCLSSANGAMNANWQSNKLKNYGIILKKDLPKCLYNDKTQKAIVGFYENEYNNAKQFLNIINFKSMRYILAKTQDSQAMVGKVYEYFPNIEFSQINSEEVFNIYFDITKKEQEIIEKTMEKYK